MSKIKFFSLLNLIITITSNSVSISLNKKIENNFFTIPISIGIPNNIQIFEVQVDTTTSETWVPSINTTYKISPKYDMSLSSTSNTTDKIMEIFDEDGDVTGNATHDVIKIGQYTLEEFGFVSVVNYPKNYKEAIKRGFHIVSAHIQFTKDKIPVICHETNLETISNGEGKLESKTFEELVKLDFGSKIDKKYAGEKILTFKYLLDLCKEYNLIIDLDLSKVDSENAEKTQVYLKRLLTLIDEYCMMDSIIFNEGTNPNIITKLKEMRNEISISIPNMNKKEYIEKVKDKYVGSKRVIYDFSRISEGENIDEESVKFGVSLGHKIKASIVDNLETANKIEKWGVSYITTKVLHPFLMKNEKQDPIIVRCSPLDDHTSECEIDDDIPLKDNEYYNIYYTDNIYNISQDINLEPIGSFQFIDTNLLDELYYIVKKFDFEQGIIQLSISHELEKGEEIMGAVGPSDEISTECYQYNFVCHGNGSHFVDCKIEKDDDDKVHYNGKYSIYYVEDYSLNEFEFEEHIQEDEHKEDTYIEYIVEKKTSYFFVFIIIIIIIIILAFLYFCKWRNENYYNVIRNTDNNYMPDDYLYR